MKTIAQVVLPNGEIAERQSTSRIYTHAVLFTDTPFFKTFRIARAEKHLAEQKAKLAAAMAAITDETTETKFAEEVKAIMDAPYDNSNTVTHEQKIAAIDVYYKIPVVMRDHAMEYIAAAEEALAEAKVDQEPSIYQWSMSEQNALAGAKKFAGNDYYAGASFTVVPTTQSTKAAKTKKRGVRK